MTSGRRFPSRSSAGALLLVVLSAIAATPAAACTDCPLFTTYTPAGGNAFRFEIGQFTADTLLDIVVSEPNGPWGAGAARLLKGARAAGDTGYVLLPAVTIATGDLVDVGAGDFDHDGKADLALVDKSGHSLRILRNLGNGTFTPDGSFGLGDDAASVTVVDADQDGALDLIVPVRASYGAAMFKGDKTGGFPDGTFTEIDGPGAGPRPVSVAVGDLDGDGIRDFVVYQDSDSSLNIEKGLGSGGVWNGQYGGGAKFKVIDTPTHIQMGDINGDGHLDLFACTYSGRGRILLGDGAGVAVSNFTDAGIQFHGKAPIGLADFSHDGRLTMVIADPGEDFVISQRLRSAPGAPDSVWCEYTTLGHPVQAAVADLDADGFLDIVAVSPYSLHLSVMLRRCSTGTLDVTPKPGASFAISRLSPNPSHGSVAVEFVLPDAAPSSLELLDPAGRRVSQDEVGSLGAGRHQLALASGRRLAPGVYLVRLTRAGVSRTMRAVVLR